MFESILLALALLLPGGLKQDAKAQASDPYKISVNVDLVLLQATVHNRKGGFVSGLTEPDFELYEDGVRQSIRFFRHEDVPVTVGLVIDHSGSMLHKMPEVVAAARTFVQSSRADDQMFVVNFNDYVSSGPGGKLPGSGRLTNSSEQLAVAITSMPTIGMTALYDAVIIALDELHSGQADKKALIVISDGGDNASKHKLAEVLQKAGESTALIYTIGIFDQDDRDRNPAVLRRLAAVTGGEAFFPERLEDVVSICERVARDIRNQYTLGYVSSNTARTGSFRAIRLVARSADGGKAVVRTRSGYIAGGESPPASGRGAQ